MDTNIEQPTSRGWPLFLFGVLFFVIGVAAYFVQMLIPRFETPWYLPILFTLGVVLMAISAWQRRGVFRIGGLVVFTLLCGAVWFLLGVMTKTPPYTGPAQVGQKVPAFQASFADGKAFTQGDLESGKKSALIFYRGKW
jgi:hypothetical protein